MELLLSIKTSKFEQNYYALYLILKIIDFLFCILCCRNNLINVCCHEKDFDIKVESYNFFGTSHGKNTCDAVGGTLKRAVVRHCLRSPPDQQITTPRKVYDYASTHIRNIRYNFFCAHKIKF